MRFIKNPSGLELITFLKTFFNMKKSDKDVASELKESISRLESAITLYISEGNTTARKMAQKVLDRLKSDLKKLKSK